MPRKKKTEQEVADESIMENSQTDSEMEETSPFPQTGTEDSENTLNSEQPGEPDESDESFGNEQRGTGRMRSADCGCGWQCNRNVGIRENGFREME